MLNRRTFVSLLAASPILATPAYAASPSVYEDSGLAIHGTDPVAYFDQMTAVAGSADHSLMWNGATWQFSSAKNMAKFEANPEAYAPQYGGYCAYAASKGYIATSDPEAWTVHNGKLYLNFSKSVRFLWLRNTDENIALGNANWPGILQA